MLPYGSFIRSSFIEKRTDFIFLIARPGPKWILVPHPGLLFLLSCLFFRRCCSLSSFLFPFYPLDQATNTRQSACHASSRETRDPRYVEISADLSSKLDRVLPSWGPSRVVPMSTTTAREQWFSTLFRLSEVADSACMTKGCPMERALHAIAQFVYRAIKRRGWRRTCRWMKLTSSPSSLLLVEN